MSRLKTRQIRNHHEALRFFDEIALDYRDLHGDPERLLRDRLALVRTLIGETKGQTLLEIGCGTGTHLFALANQFARVIGTDFSTRMIEQAEAIRIRHNKANNVSLAIDRAERLATIFDASIDVVLCIGAFEHMVDKARVLNQIWRVLKAGGSFVCLTPNGDYLWYRLLAPVLGVDTRHLSTDRFVTLPWIRETLPAIGLQLLDSGYWTFIPAGDVNTVLSVFLAIIDQAGRFLNLPSCRGGLYFKAGKT
ncbi:MAG: class I SAM-dependent methyltransferase [Methylococcales bacterium]